MPSSTSTATGPLAEPIEVTGMVQPETPPGPNSFAELDNGREMRLLHATRKPCASLCCRRSSHGSCGTVERVMKTYLDYATSDVLQNPREVETTRRTEAEAQR